MKIGGSVHIVRTQDTAKAVGSGDLGVLGTPVLVRWCEAATVGLLDLPAEQTSVGVKIDIAHLAPSPIDMRITTAAQLTEQTARRAVFSVKASDSEGTVVAQGTIERAIVDRAQFLAGVPRVGD